MKNNKKNKVNSWIFASFCFLVLIIGIMVYINKDDCQSRTITFTDVGFDTPVSFQAVCSQEEFDTYADIVKNTFQTQNKVFNAYDETSDLYKINQNASKQAMPIPDTLEECIRISQQAYELYPKFDISQGKLLKAWHNVRENFTSIDEIINFNYPYGMESIHIEDHHIHFSQDIELDLGGIAKGYTANLCKERLNEAGLHNGFINAGGNVVLLGQKIDNEPWTIGIQSPDNESSLVQITVSKPTSFVTSGDYQRYADIDGKRYGHIIDPQTKMPAEYVRSVTVIHDDSAWADAMSTTLFCMSLEEGLQFCQEHDLQAIWIVDAEDSHSIKPQLTTNQYSIYTTKKTQNSVELSQNFTN